MAELPITTVRSAKEAGKVKNFLIVLTDGGVTTYPLPDSGQVSIGRGETCDVTISHPSISRNHATLHLGGTFTVADLGSSNGTTVRGQPVAKNTAVEVAVNEVFALGDVTAVLQRRAGALKSRRIWSHDYFEGRVAEECARVGKSGSGFGVLHISFGSEVDPEKVQEVFAEHLSDTDVLARFGPRDYEVLLFGPPEVDDSIIKRLGYGFSARSLDPKIGSARCPRDGRDADKLLGRARQKNVVELTTGPRARAVVLEDDVMKNLYNLAQRIAVGTINVLVLGETGVGKQVLAEAIHRYSPRRDQPFLELNCSAFSEQLLESELFGHEKGAFTGADRQKTGLLESASGGTVFLDEIGDMALPLQAKLLRALENQEVLAVGSLKAKKIDVRFVAATNRDLEAEVARGNFRQDLFFRINGVTLQVPPLRERVREIESLARSFARDYAQALGGRSIEISPQAIEMLTHYSWPGNIRELRNVMERATLLCVGNLITPEHLPVEKMEATYSVQSVLPGGFPSRAAATAPSAAAPGGDESDEEKKQRVWEALMSCGGNNTEAAKLLGVSRRTLGKWLETFGLPRPRKQRRTDSPE